LAAATGQFLAIVLAEIAYGVTIGWLMLRVRHVADPRCIAKKEPATGILRHCQSVEHATHLWYAQCASRSRLLNAL